MSICYIARLLTSDAVAYAGNGHGDLLQQPALQVVGGAASPYKGPNSSSSAPDDVQGPVQVPGTCAHQGLGMTRTWLSAACMQVRARTIHVHELRCVAIGLHSPSCHRLRCTAASVRQGLHLAAAMRTHEPRHRVCLRCSGRRCSSSKADLHNSRPTLGRPGIAHPQLQDIEEENTAPWVQSSTRATSCSQIPASRLPAAPVPEGEHCEVHPARDCKHSALESCAHVQGGQSYAQCTQVLARHQAGATQATGTSKGCTGMHAAQLCARGGRTGGEAATHAAQHSCSNAARAKHSKGNEGGPTNCSSC